MTTNTATIVAPIITTLGVPLLAIALFTGYEAIAYIRRNLKKAPIGGIPNSVKP